MATAPCKNCKERHKGCWSECEAYKAYDEENKRRLAAAHKEKHNQPIPCRQRQAKREDVGTTATKERKELVTMAKCLLELSPRWDQCSEAQCEHCVWRSDNFEKRKALLKKRGLTECEDGLRRLIIPKKGGTEND